MIVVVAMGAIFHGSCWYSMAVVVNVKDLMDQSLNQVDDKEASTQHLEGNMGLLYICAH